MENLQKKAHENTHRFQGSFGHGVGYQEDPGGYMLILSASVWQLQKLFKL